MSAFKLMVLLAFCTPSLAATLRVGSGVDCDAANLAAAIALAEAGDVIELNGEDFPATQVVIPVDLTLRGGGQACQSVGATGPRARLLGTATPGSVIRVRFGAVLRATGLILEGGSAELGGGLWIDLASRVDANDLLINGNSASVSGGGVYVGQSAIFAVQTGLGGSDAGVEIIGNQAVVGGGIALGSNAELLFDAPASRIADNSAGDGGGLAVSPSARFALGEVLIENHTVNGLGGGIFVQSSAGSPNVLRLSTDQQTQIRNNQALHGGGIYLQAGSQCRIELGALLVGNSATLHGGAVAAEPGSCRIALQGARLQSNVAGDRGGAVSIASGAGLELFGSLLSGNSAQFGGAVAAENASLKINAGLFDGLAIGSELLDNQASQSGGGIWLSGSASTLFVGNSSGACLPHCRLAGNQASVDGGGLWIQDAYVELHPGTELLDNVALGDGGGLWAQGAALLGMASDSNIALRIHGNLAGDDGGGLHLLDAGATLNWAEIGMQGLGNSASDDGGGIYARSSLNPAPSLQLINSRVNHNDANDGGGIYAQGIDVLFSADLGNDEVLSDAPDCDPTSLPANRHCAELSRNQAAANGGGARVTANADLRLTGVGLRGNQAATGAAVSAFGADDLVLQRCLVAEQLGDALHMQVGGALQLSEVSLLANSGSALRLDGSAESLTAQIERSLIWGNGQGLSPSGSVALSSSCNNTQDNSLNGISSAPELVSNLRGDYHYAAGSAGVDLCVDGLPADLDGSPRPIGSGWDVGAFEGEFAPFIDPIFADQFETP
ncbi:MAG: hypothetical protein KDI48_09395 [Xanthomonadales bacterium]|nr:hypothetical protein [Xanthomonadales bacterium]